MEETKKYKNLIMRRSKLYIRLSERYGKYAELLDSPDYPEKEIDLIKEHRLRFEECYNIVDNEEYKEICYLISLLNESSESENVGIETIDMIISGTKKLFFSNLTQKEVFIRDLLEEARERKRP